MNCRGFHFKIIDKCNSRCDHCSYCSDSEMDGIMQVDFFKDILHSYKQKLEWLSILGGEPFLHPNLVSIVGEACKSKADRVWLYTNGFWGGSERAIKMLKQLKSAGLKYLAISADYFHDKYISFSSVRKAYKLALKTGFKTYVEFDYLQDNLADNVADTRTAEMEHILSPVKKFTTVIQRIGRASLLEESFHAIGNRNTCQPPVYIGDYRHPHGFDINFEGLVSLCPGITIGKINGKSGNSGSLKDILNSYNWRNNPITSIIVSSGPDGLITEHGDIFKDKLREKMLTIPDPCKRCFTARQYLLERYKKILRPVTVYNAC